MIGFILLFTILNQNVFFTLMALLGTSYSGIDDSPLYVISVVGLDIISCLYIFFYEILNYKKAKGSIKWYFIPLIFFILYMFNVAFPYSTGNDDSSILFRNFIVFSIPSIAIGNFCYRYEKMNLLLKNIDIMVLLMTLGVLRAMPQMFFLGEFSIGGATYQTLSYVSAFSFGLNLCNILGASDEIRYPFFRSSVYQIFSIILLFVQILGVLISGGRGGMVLLLLNAVMLLYYLGKQHIKKMFLFLIVFLPLSYLAVSNISYSGISDFIDRGVNRIFSYVSSSGIDMTETSGRDIVYETAIECIEEKPLLGHGLFQQYDLIKSKSGNPYCHNIFLEVLLQGGIIYLIVFISLMLFLLKKMMIIIKKKSEYSLIPLFMYPATMLLFSGTYITCSLFWFILSYVLSSDRRKILNKTK